MDPDVVIVGGGIGGLAAALAVTRAGLRAQVLERAPEFGEVGAGLQMAPNATRVLRSWGLLDEIVRRGVVPRRLVMRDAVDSQELTHLDLADTERRYGAPYVVIHRSDLHDSLLQACRDHNVLLHTGVDVTDVEVSGDHAVAIAGQERFRGAVVLAADGLNSLLRAKLSDDRPISSGYVAYRGTIPAAEPFDDVIVYVGPYCHFVQYSLRGGSMLNQVAVFRSPKALAGEQDWGTPDELDAAFEGTCDTVRTGLPRLWRDRWWPMYDREPITRWVDRRLALIGDAAHPMLQYLAQGACQAIEDADTLAGFAAKHPGDWDTALARYAESRTVRTARVQRTARKWGDLWHCDGLFRSVRNELLRGRDPADYRHVDWLYEG